MIKLMQFGGGALFNVKCAQTHQYSMRVKQQRFLAMQEVAGGCFSVWV
jgi:hypothetical protein